ncbi:mucin-5AC-like [Portunus trituberculatus]|uniref:mucin-5AC-like n=1 Tax=Portunus trituberculatus TaxID=210409 RepID=UPI001E1D00F2|nr:mucin-5AC-like [Portunus trituberculatus]
MPAQTSTGRSRALSTEVSPPEEYFRGVSPLCRRLLDDMKAVRESWGENWHQLSYQQQCRVIDQAIVDEATVRRYDESSGGVGEGGPECEYFPKLKLTTGQKVVCDENLTARGFSCSWRDEHSAPFSWHTRSQMDLTLDTPPATPTHPGTPVETPPTTVSGEGRVIPGGRAVYTARPVSLPKPPRFRWHYDPPDDPPDPPSVVVAAPRASTLPREVTTETKKSPTSLKYMLVRGRGEDGVGAGLLTRIRGAVVALTATCLPLRASPGHGSLFSSHRDGGGKEADLKASDLRGIGSRQQQQQQQHGRSGDHTATSTLTTTTTTNLTPGEGGEGDTSTLPSLSRLSPDPTLAGYVCSLPDDDDDMPYTAAPRPAPAAAPCDSLLFGATSPLKPKSSSKTTLTPYSASDSAACTSLPTPLPTPTLSEEPPSSTVTFSQMSDTPSPRPPLAKVEDTLSSFSEPDSTLDALDTPREEQPLLASGREREMSLTSDTEEVFKSVLSNNRDSNIPKTGFDFLDNW